MNTITALKTLVIWVGIVVLAIANGALREALLIPTFGAFAGFILSGLLLSVVIIGVAYLSLPWLQISRPAQLWGVGLSWLILTLIFEFSFGFWQGKPWSELLHAYTFKDGNIWPAVLVVTVVAPYIAAKLRR